MPVVAPTLVITKACFAGTEVVTLSTGVKLPISEVRIGDSILAYSRSDGLKYSEVIALPHGKNTHMAEFIRLELSSGRDIKITSAHLLPVADCTRPTITATTTTQSDVCSTRDIPYETLKAASTVHIGQCLLTTTGQEEVIGVYRTYERGIYTAITLEEFIVVNDIIASPYAVSHVIGHSFYHIPRVLYSLFPSVRLSDWMSSAVPRVLDELSGLVDALPFP